MRAWVNCMSKEEAKQAAPAPAPTAVDQQEAPSAKKGKAMTFAVFGGIMLIEGVAIFAAMKSLGHEPDPTVGMEIHAPTSKPWDASTELPVVQIRVPNSRGARTMLYSVKVVARVEQSHVEEAKAFLEKRKSTIEDVIGRVIRSADAAHLAEPGLETLKRQVRYEMNTLMGDAHLIEQVLIPECMPLSAGF
jgi:flagellar basal body-associated protein FliL